MLKWLLYLIISIGAVCMVNATITCQYSTSCPMGYIEFFRAQDIDNAQVELISGSLYPYKICCKSNVTQMGNNCSAEAHAHLGQISNITNAHFQFSGISNYTYYVCMSGYDIECRFVANGSCSSNRGETCVFALSSQDNAHVGQCTGSYNNRVCCHDSFCSNGKCEYGETCNNCPDDCGICGGPGGGGGGGPGSEPIEGDLCTEDIECKDYCSDYKWANIGGYCQNGRCMYKYFTECPVRCELGKCVNCPSPCDNKCLVMENMWIWYHNGTCVGDVCNYVMEECYFMCDVNKGCLCKPDYTLSSNPKECCSNLVVNDMCMPRNLTKYQIIPKSLMLYMEPYSNKIEKIVVKNLGNEDIWVSWNVDNISVWARDEYPKRIEPDNYYNFTFLFVSTDFNTVKKSGITAIIQQDASLFYDYVPYTLETMNCLPDGYNTTDSSKCCSGKTINGVCSKITPPSKVNYWLWLFLLLIFFIMLLAIYFAFRDKKDEEYEKIKNI